MSPAPDPECIFCKILAGQIPATIVAESATAIAFTDISPRAPLHVQVIPREHHPSAAALAQADPATLAELVTLAARVAAEAGVADYRLVFNTGAGVGQSVFHVHLHVLGGRPMRWPPG